MKRSKRIETLDQRPVNLDGFINEWPEMGFVAMSSPYDPKPSVKVREGKIVELDGKKREEFDFIDQFIADYAIDIERAEKSMSVPALNIARMIVDIHVSRKEILELISGITPAKMVEVMNHLNVVEHNGPRPWSSPLLQNRAVRLLPHPPLSAPDHPSGS